MPEEDFDLLSLAEFLHLQPDQVRRMTDRGRLPGRRIGGEWRFSRAEIHQWFEERIGASGERELDEVDRLLDLQDKKQTHASRLTVNGRYCLMVIAHNHTQIGC